jgi:hypothetical protein
MNELKLIVVLICVVSINAFAQVPPEQIYEKYYAALGGKDNLLAIKTLTIISKDITKIGIKDSIITDTTIAISYFKRPSKYRIEIATPKIPQLQLIVYNNSKGYFYDSLDNKTLQDSMVNKYSAIYSNFVGYRIIPELYYAESGVKSTYAGIMKIGNIKAYKIICELKGIKWYNFYSVRNNLKIRETQFWNEDAPFNIDILNYKIVEGIKFPFPDKSNVFNLRNIQYIIKINEPIDDEKFKID